MSFDTQTFVRTAKKHKGTALGTGSLGLSAAAVIWMFHTFVTVHEYEKDYKNQQQQNALLWHEIHEIHTK